ncbi:MAG TPA: NAD-dependent epimerase/dehydratase family protein [Phototrophicaceae bacterium]|jgi:nucleoside-diphosphate-sugar epimerase|nr:NAD-dependent epimerase/dehydratase family protein [Phototrophicaceae bacterium]
MAETVLVTGGTGYVAGWCIVELLKRGYTVRTTVRSLSKEQVVRSNISTAVDPGASERLSFFVADLTSDTGWDAAVTGCDYILHVASPLGTDNPKNPDELIIPARDGALRVLRAAAGVGVKRVVMTSACAAASPASYTEDGVTDETLWTDPDDSGLSAYRKSKTVAELAAWEFMKDNHGATTLTTILPRAVFGPILSADNIGTAQVIGRLLQGRVPGTPRIGLEVVDVRDLADVHIRAMTASGAGGERFIAFSEFMWMSDIAKTLHAKLGSAASKVPTRTLPDFMVRFLARFDPGLQALIPGLGRKNRHTAEKARRVLGWHPRPAAETVIDCAVSLISRKAI